MRVGAESGIVPSRPFTSGSLLQFARPGFDIGLFTNQPESQLSFWQSRVGLVYDHLGKLGGGIHQHRHHLHGVVLKLNAARDPLPAMAPGGFRALRIAVDEPGAQSLATPDGLPVDLVPKGDQGTWGTDVLMAVSNLATHVEFYRTACGLRVDEDGTVHHGPTRLRVAAIEPVARGPDWRGPGLRYLTLQVADARSALAQALAAGAEAADPLRDLGDLVRFCFIRDPDGNFLELSERTSFTGRPLCP